MDPNEALRGLRSLTNTSHRWIEKGKVDEHTDWQPIVEQFVELFQALDEWLSQGGFLPEAWRQPIAARLMREQILGKYGPPVTIEPLGPPNPAHGELP
jgi:hypothetical protein